MDVSELLEWDTESLTRHRVQVVSAKAERTQLREGNSVWELVPRITNLDGTLPELLGVEFELLDEDGIQYAVASHALHSGNGPKLRGLAVTRVIAWSEDHETPRITMVRARVIPGAPHPTRKPLPIRVAFDRGATMTRGHDLLHVQADATWQEWSGPAIKVSLRSAVSEGALPAVSLYAVDADGVPFSHNLLHLEPDPDTQGERIGVEDWSVQRIPDRITLSIPDQEFLTKVSRAWNLEEFEEY